MHALTHGFESLQSKGKPASEHFFGAHKFSGHTFITSFLGHSSAKNSVSKHELDKIETTSLKFNYI